MENLTIYWLWTSNILLFIVTLALSSVKGKDGGVTYPDVFVAIALIACAFASGALGAYLHGVVQKW